MDVTQLSENTILVLFEQTIALSVSKEVFIFASQVEANFQALLIDIVPSYCSVHLTFDLGKISGVDFIKQLYELDALLGVKDVNLHREQKRVKVPVYYGSEVGFDLENVAKASSLSIEQVIEVHSRQVYDAYAVGFAPGFAYLGIVDERIATPRKKTPRQFIPAGSLGIADQQTAIYPSISPGGWQIIGRTPKNMVDFSDNTNTPTLINVGDQVQFIPVSKREYLKMGGEL